MKARLFVLATILSASTFYSCSKDDSPDETTPPDDLTAQELTAARIQSDLVFDDVSSEVLQVSVNGTTGAASTTSSACATVTISPQDLTTWPKTVVIDYGSTGCTGINGWVRKGKISYTLTKLPRETGAVVNVSFDNYSVNGYKLEGSYSITNNGSSDANLNITTRLVNGKITYPDGKWYTRSSTINWQQVAGSVTASVLDDEFNVTGEAVIKSSANNELITSSKTPLLRKVTCGNFVSGQLNVNYNGIAGVLDFGGGTCDKNATLSLGTRNYEVTLP
ncbi:MAG: hypothetical protein EAZ17_06295 [Sphingobacteriales bacterium]|nr:MAG: hypothetical protein EAZ17_06295 [Sphingobacteriales bacterium]